MNKENFELYCQDHKTWVSSYIFLKDCARVYFIWYEDIDENDKLLTYNSGKIITSPSVNDLLELLRNVNEDFARPEHLDSWLINMTELTPVESITYSPSEILKGFKENTIDRAVLNDFVNLFNLYGDLGHQDPMYREILTIQDSSPLGKAWDYFYDNYFWKSTKRVKLDIDRAALVADFGTMVKKFEEFMN